MSERLVPVKEKPASWVHWNSPGPPKYVKQWLFLVAFGPLFTILLGSGVHHAGPLHTDFRSTAKASETEEEGSDSSSEAFGKGAVREGCIIRNSVRLAYKDKGASTDVSRGQYT